MRDRINKANEIIPGLFLGNELAACDNVFIKKHNITLIVNCTKEVKCSFEDSCVMYIRLPLDDSLQKKDINLMTSWMPYVLEQIRYNKDILERNVLVHCHAGMQRSAIIVAAYLVENFGMTPQEAIDFIVKRRDIAFHNGESLNFIESLEFFYNSKINFAPKCVSGNKIKNKVKVTKKDIKRYETEWGIAHSEYPGHHIGEKGTPPKNPKVKKGVHKKINHVKVPLEPKIKAKPVEKPKKIVI